MTPGNNKAYLGLHVKCPILPDLNQIWIFVTGFHTGSPVSNFTESVQWEQQWYMRTDGRTLR